MKKRQKYDRNAPGTAELVDQIVHGAYTTEGTMVAFPLCFPASTAPIRADESHVTALTVAPDGIIYGGTSGRLAHFFVAMFHGATGIVFDMGSVDGTDHCAAVCCGDKHVVACMNGPGGGRVVRRSQHRLPFDLLQEWGFVREPFDGLGAPVPGERIIHAVALGNDQAVVATEGHLALLSIAEGSWSVVGEILGAGKIARMGNGTVVGLDEEDALWAFDPADQSLQRKAIPLPAGAWYDAPVVWARDPNDGTLYTADGAGRLFALRGADGFSDCLGHVPVPPVLAMAATYDGRVFGAGGEGIAKTFCYNPAAGEPYATGVAVSVLERRRYGYVFGDAVTGRDGQIIFGENDDLGHLWLYFPRILGP